MNTTEKINKARTRLLIDSMFFGSIAMRLELIPDCSIPTMFINSKAIKYNPDFVDGLSMYELIGCLAHEILHVAGGHPWRENDRDHTLFSMAGDYVINDILLTDKFSLPAGCLYDKRFSGMSVEEVYTVLKKEKEEQQKEEQQKEEQQKEEQQKEEQQKEEQQKEEQQKEEQQKDDNSGDDNSGDDNSGDDNSGDDKNKNTDIGGCGDYESETDSIESKENEIQWKQIISQAHLLSKGSIPAGLDRMIQSFINPETPWSVLLRDFVSRTAKNDYTWTRPNTRYSRLKFILPSLISDELPKIVIGIDTSGSISQELLDLFAAEVSSIFNDYDATIEVIYCDYVIHGIETYTKSDLPLKLSPKGGGGTSFRPVFDYIENSGDIPACLIYFTDLCGSFPEKEPDYPVLWISTSGLDRVPFGDVIKIKL